MPFTDLDEHLAEAFGEQVAEVPALPARAKSPESYRRAESKAKSNQRRKRALAAKRTARWLAELLDGTRPSRCDGPGCCNLLAPWPKRGAGITFFCGEDCSSARGYRRRAAARREIPAPESRRRHTKTKGPVAGAPA